MKKKRHAIRIPLDRYFLILVGLFLLLALLLTLIVLNDGPTKLPGVDLSRLDEDQQDRAVQVMQKEPSPCGCKLTIAVCRERDRTCQTSIRLGRSIVEKIRLDKL